MTNIEIAQGEKHFTASAAVRDVTFGMADGLTVPFALAAGLSGAVDHSSIIVIAGMAEIVAGSISMGLGGYLAARNDIEHYETERKREYDEVRDLPHVERAEVVAILKTYGLSETETVPIMNAFEKNPDAWVDFMMRNELFLEEPDRKRVLKSPLTIGTSYVIGGLIPLSPYFFIDNPIRALTFSIIWTAIALLIFGFVKSKLLGSNPWVGAIRVCLVTGIAAAAAYTLAKLIS